MTCRPCGPPLARAGVPAAVACLTIVALLAAPIRAAGQTATATTLKAAFVYNFAKFTEWPSTALASGQRLALCVVGDTAVADALEQTIRGRSHEGHELTVQILTADGPLQSCHVVYVDGRDAARVATVLETLRDQPVFTVGDRKDFAKRGGIAQLILERDRMRFAINVSAAMRAGLTLSSRLLSLATIVRDGDGGA